MRFWTCRLSSKQPAAARFIGTLTDDLPIRVIRRAAATRENPAMAYATLTAFSNELGQLAAAVAATIVQVQGARRPASGVVHGPDTIVTTARAIGREDGLRV